MRHLLLLATLCCLCLHVVQGAVSKIPLQVEEFDDSYEVAHIAMMVTSFSVAGFLVFAVLGLLAVKGKTSLANMLLVMVFAAVIVVGMVSWIITYVKMRDEMQEKVQSLITLAGDGVDVAILRTLESGVTIGNLYARQRAFGETSMNVTFPGPVLGLHALRHAFRGKDAAILGLYYGTKWGYTLGGYPSRTNPDEISMYLGYPASAPISMLQGFNCRGWDLENAGCENVDCSTGASVHCGATCLIHNTTNCYWKDPGVSRIIYFDTPWGEVVIPPTTEKTWSYEPRLRPWYLDAMAADGEPVWTAPYAFASFEGDAPEIAFSYEFAVKHPVTGVAEGVFAVDYTLGSLHQVLLGLIPTKHSSILMSDLSGNLFASSTFASDVATINIAPDGKKSYEVANVFTHSRAEIRDVFHDIRRVVGSLNEASQLRRLIQLSDSTLLVSPLNMTGLYLLIVVEVPHKDILEAVNDASTLSLAVVLIISVVLAGLVSGLIYVLASKLERLSQDMHDVAWMKVEDTNIEANSIVSEIHSMQESFALLVKNMMEYRQYLPQSLLADSESEEECELSLTKAKQQQQRAQQLFDSGLSDQNVSVVCCNWRGTHERLTSAKKGGNLQTFTDAYGKYLEMAMQLSKQMRGVIDYFNGDRVCVTFNAVVPTALHARKSAEFASVLTGKGGESGQEDSSLVCGLSSGATMCGNVGCTGMKKFIVFGKTVTAAHALVRLATMVNETIVMGASSVEAIKHFFVVKYIRQLSLPHCDKPTWACSLVSALQATDQEWMYEMEEAQKKDPYSDYNSAVRLLCEGNYAGASESAEKSSLPASELSALKDRIVACRDAGKPEAPLIL